MLSELINQTCWIVTRPGSGDGDSYYGAEADETAATAVETVCEIQQRRRDEPNAEGELSKTDWLGIFPLDVVLKSSSAVVTEDRGTFELEGDPWKVWDPFAQQYDHVEADLVRVSGPEDDLS